MFSCLPTFKVCLECVQGPSFSATQSYAKFHDEFQAVRLDTSKMGDDVVLLKNDQRICGSGVALGTTPIVQNKAYFEVNIQQTGIWGIGLANHNVNLNLVPPEKNSWYVSNDGQLIANGVTIDRLAETFEEGDCIGIAFDHIDLQFFKNGVLLGNSLSNVKGQIFPMIFVSDNAILDASFHKFCYKIPPGFEQIMIEQTIL